MYFVIVFNRVTERSPSHQEKADHIYLHRHYNIAINCDAWDKPETNKDMMFQLHSRTVILSDAVAVE